jgi:hypothetical protein
MIRFRIGNAGDVVLIFDVLSVTHIAACSILCAHIVKQGCKDAGALIFSDPVIQQIAEQYFIPAAFNTWDRSNSKFNAPMRQWSAGLESS